MGRVWQLTNILIQLDMFLNSIPVSIRKDCGKEFGCSFS